MEIERQKNNSRLILAVFLIIVGAVWLLRKLSFYIDFSVINFEPLFYPLRQLFHWLKNVVFSWPMIIIIIGLVLMAGRRTSGLVLLIVGGIFLIPKIFFLPGLTISFLFPVLLIGFGVAMVARLI